MHEMKCQSNCYEPQDSNAALDSLEGVIYINNTTLKHSGNTSGYKAKIKIFQRLDHGLFSRDQIEPYQTMLDELT